MPLPQLCIAGELVPTGSTPPATLVVMSHLLYSIRPFNGDTHTHANACDPLLYAWLR